jgi:hypothetical protein
VQDFSDCCRHGLFGTGFILLFQRVGPGMFLAAALLLLFPAVIIGRSLEPGPRRGEGRRDRP